MSDLFGTTRTVIRSRYALVTPDGFVPSMVPGWKDAVVVVNISPAMVGPRFTQLQVTLGKEGTGEGNTGANQYFIYVTEGTGSILLQDKRHRLEAGSYIYLPPSTDMQLKSTGAMRLLIFQKRYQVVKGTVAPLAMIGHEREVKGQPFLGNEDARLQVLLPDEKSFDMAVNIFTYQPGATLPFVETHVMEHGLLMLRGQGVYRLDSDYHPVKAGDVIWMGPFCPQWFVAMGKTPASYIYYKDVNRDPM